MKQEDIEKLAEWLHEKYEQASIVRGWKTQDKCKVDFWDLPEANRFVMLDLAAFILQRFGRNHLPNNSKKETETK